MFICGKGNDDYLTREVDVSPKLISLTISGTLKLHCDVVVNKFYDYRSVREVPSL